MYLCDHEKNTECPKNGCGTLCFMTTKKEYMKVYDIPAGEALKVMMSMQKAFQCRLYPNFNDRSIEERMQYFKEHSIHLTQEIHEALYEIPFFKPWKDYSKMTHELQSVAIHKAKLEMVDAWHFFMNMLLALGMNANELFALYVDKNKENYRRQNAGYSHAVQYREVK